MSLKDIPEPNFIERDLEGITSEMVRYYEEKTGKTVLPAQVESILIDMIAYREYLVRLGVQRAAQQNLLQFASKEKLDYLGDLVGAKRDEDQSALTVFKFSLKEPLAFDVTVPAATRISSKDGTIIFKTLQEITINQGHLFEFVPGEALKKGPAGNGYKNGQLVNLLDPVDYIFTVENVRETSGGCSREDDDHYRERIRLRPEAYSMAGTAPAYTYWTKTAHPDIIDVAVSSPAPCEVEICPLFKNQHTYDDGALQNMKNRIEGVLNDEKIKPLGDRITVILPERVDFRIQANIKLYNYSDRDMVKSELDKKITGFAMQQRGKLGKDINWTKIFSLISEIYGVREVYLKSPDKSVVLNNNQWANCLNTFDAASFTTDFNLKG